MGLDHVVFAFRSPSGWGAVGGSRDVGLWGRRPMFRNIEALARSYYEPYIDLEARITAFALVDLRKLGAYDWRLSNRNAWKVERCFFSTCRIRPCGRATVAIFGCVVSIANSSKPMRPATHRSNWAPTAGCE